MEFLKRQRSFRQFKGPRRQTAARKERCHFLLTIFLLDDDDDGDDGDDGDDNDGDDGRDDHHDHDDDDDEVLMLELLQRVIVKTVLASSQS